MRAYCGLDCGTCGAYIATAKDDDAARQAVADQWCKEYGANVKAEDINCDGCASDSARLFRHCNVCEIRACARTKAVSNCGRCDQFGCATIESFLQQVPQCRDYLTGERAR